ncbi:hypothetical protein [Tateyamaria sp. SN6-1]
MTHWAVATLDDIIDIAAQDHHTPQVSSRVLTAGDIWADET